jgi:hypothetical protein
MFLIKKLTFDRMNFLKLSVMCSAWQKKPNFAEQKIAEQTASRTKQLYAPKKSSAGRKTTGEETIDLDTPPRKKPGAAAACYSIEKRGCYTVNPYAHRSKNKIDVVLHEGGVASPPRMPSPRSPSYLEGRH